jgi:hypothetical protein
MLGKCRYGVGLPTFPLLAAFITAAVCLPVAPVRLPSQPSGLQDCGPPQPAAAIWQRHIFTTALSRAQTGAQRYHDAYQPRGLHFPAEQLPM